jgi:predicted porin
MKKTLIALALLSTVSGAAMAQSSVTLYGIADIGLGKSVATGETKWGAQSNGILNNSNSRIGFTGTEDLGGGLKAGFRFEGNINLANGAAGGGGGTTGGATWSREANVFLGSKTFGTLKLGRSFAPAFDADAVWELTGEANYSVIANTYGFGGGPFLRNNAQLEYQSPNLAGFSAEIAYIPKADGGLLDGGYGVANRTDRWDVNVAYQQGPIAVALDANKSNKTDTVNYPGSDKVNYSVGGQYKFGKNFAATASYHHGNAAQQWSNRLASGAGALVFAKRYGYALGGSATLGQFVVTLELTRDTRNQVYDGRKYTNGMLEGKYNMSKRTFLYAAYLRLDGTNNYGLGICHSF